MTKHPTDWQLPPGVTRSLWDYFQRDAIAEDYDAYFEHHALLQLDQRLVEHVVEKTPAIDGGPATLADLGCGTARALIPFVERGHQGLAIDLSAKMLAVAKRKAAAMPGIQCLRANLVDLGGVRKGSVDVGFCLFSTLGMIRGREHREAALKEAFRILRPGGRLVLHVHNFWFNLYDPGGWRRVPLDVIRRFWNRSFERGDRYFYYRGVPNMFLHSFTAGELTRLTQQAGLTLEELIPLASTYDGPLRNAGLAPSLRAIGWIVVAQKPGGGIFTPGSPCHMGSAAIDSEALTASLTERPVTVVHFWARWNGYDRQLEAELRPIREEYVGRVAFRSADVDDPDLAEFRRNCEMGPIVPTLVGFVNGRRVDKLLGVPQPEKVREWIDRLIAKAEKPD